MDGCEAVIHLVGIIEERKELCITFEKLHVEATRFVLQAARQAGIQRFIHISANGASPEGASRYQTTKWEAEELVCAAGFKHWAILRAGIVFGEPAPGTIEFCTRLARELILPLPIIPLFGMQDFRLQPVSVEELAEAFVQALTRDAVHGRRITAVGQQSYPYREVLDRIALGLGRKPRPKVALPLSLIRTAIKRLGPLGIVPITRDQLEMLISGNTGDPTDFYELFDLTPRPFSPANLAYLQRRA